VDTGAYAVVLALLAGTLRALSLWRAASRVEVVNVVVLNALAQGRGHQLETLLRGSGSGPYLAVAGAIGRAALELRESAPLEQSPRQALQHAARAALFDAGRRLRRHAWLDFVSLAAIAYAGIDAITRASATPFKAVALLAATLLWLANLRTARSIATHSYAGAGALVDSLLASFEEIPDFAAGVAVKQTS
jgi:hypothetical protein